jgi:hypothetical protein
VKIYRQITVIGFPNPNFTFVEEPAFYSIRRRFKVPTESAISEIRPFVSLIGSIKPVAPFGRSLHSFPIFTVLITLFGTAYQNLIN